MSIPPRRARALIAAGAAAAALVAAGCSSDAGDAAQTSTTHASPDTDHGESGHESDAHSGHGSGESEKHEAEGSAPTVTNLTAVETDDGWEITWQTEGFTLRPATGGDHVEGEGHAHVAINGEEVGMVDGESFFVGPDALQVGDVVVVTLATNDHRTYTENGDVIHDMYTITE